MMVIEESGEHEHDYHWIDVPFDPEYETEDEDCGYWECYCGYIDEDWPW